VQVLGEPSVSRKGDEGGMADKKPLVVTPEDWRKYKSVTECHICNESLVKAEYRDSFDVYNPNTGEYNAQSHKRCYYQAWKGFVGPLRERKPKGPEKENEDCIFCKAPLLVNSYKDAVKDHFHITGKYLGAAHNACNLKLRLKPKTAPIPVVFHNLKGYDGHLLMQATARVQGEISCIPNNTEKYISFSLGNLRFVDRLNILMTSLDALVKGSTPEDMKITGKNCEDSEKRNLLLKKGIYPYEYMDGFERFAETELPAKEEDFSKFAGKGITDEEYAHAKRVWAEFGYKTLGDYHDLYVKTDVVLLADV